MNPAEITEHLISIFAKYFDLEIKANQKWKEAYKEILVFLMDNVICKPSPPKKAVYSRWDENSR